MSKRVRIRVAIVISLIAAVIVLPPFINVNRFRLRISDSISRALGRQVTISHVGLRLVPEPGFTLENLVVADDPALSAEPMLRADEVTASLRLASLWRGRLEIARLSLSYPSLNLVRGADGKFNLESLLTRASQTPVAPTTAKRAEARPRFPYIEADGGRINFKTGLEKKVFSFTDADFALWSPGENEWRMRLEARPIRTDMPVNDTGTVTLEASFRRAAKLSETPVQMRVSLDRAQMGQLTKLVYGRDRGWRGQVNVDIQASGKPSDLALVANTDIQDFRRYDIYSEDNIRLLTRCTGRLSSVRETLTDINCQLPLGDGVLEARGNIDNFFRGTFDLGVTAKKVPLAAAVTVMKHAKKDLPADLTAAGAIDAAFSFTRSPDTFSAQGGGSASSLTLSSNSLQNDVAVSRMDFSFQRAPVELATVPRRSRKKKLDLPTVTRLEVLPFAVSLGGAAPATASAWIGREAYQLAVKGDSDLQRLLQIGKALGIQTPALAATGSARLDLKIGGQWQGFGTPQPAGTMQLRNVRAEVPGISTPLQIASTSANLDPERLGLQSLVADVGPMHVTGSITLPRTCPAGQTCPATFDLHADSIDTAELNQLLNPRTRKRPWYKLLSSRDAEDSLLAKVNATGTISADQFNVRGVVASKLSARLNLHDSIAEFSNVRAELFGGTHSGALTAEFAGERPSYKGAGSLEKVSMSDLSEAMKDGWATGTLSGKYQFRAEGWSAADLLGSANGSMDFTWNHGSLEHVSLAGTDALRFKTYAGRLELAKGVLTIDGSKLQTTAGIYEVSGNARPDSTLDFTLTRGGTLGYKITGSLKDPRVAHLPEKQASAPLSR